MLLFNNNKLLSRQTRLLSKVSTPSISVRFSKNVAKNALNNIGNTSIKTAHHAAPTKIKPIYSKEKTIRYPTLDKKKELFFELSKKPGENYIFKESSTSLKKLNVVKQLPLKSSGYKDTLKNIKISGSEDQNQSIIQDKQENPNRFIDQSTNRSIFDVENEAALLIEQDVVKISILPETNLKDQLQNIKVIVGVKHDQLSDERHIFIGKITKILPDNSLEIFGSILASGTIQKDVQGNFEYLLESKNRILKDTSGLVQAISVPKTLNILPGWNFVLKFSINQDTVCEASSIIVLELQNPGSITHETCVQASLKTIKQQIKEHEDKEANLNALLNTFSNPNNPNSLVNSIKGQGGQTGQGGQGGNLPPI